MVRARPIARSGCSALLLATALAASSAAAQTGPDEMAANSWWAAPNSAMAAVAPTPGQFAGTWGVVGPAAVISAWGGAALDTARLRLVLWGGGHADYYGNELYAFSIQTLTWARLTDPFVDPVLDQEVNADGTPNSRHTYGGLAYLAHADRFFGQAGSLAGVGSARCDRTWVFDLAGSSWTDRAPATSPGGGFGCTATYAPDSGKLWWGACAASFAGLWSYDDDTNTWTKHNDDNFYEHTSAYDSTRGLLVVVGNGEVFAYDVRGQSYTRQAWSTSGGDAFIARSAPGLDYDPVADRIVGWHGGPVYALDVEARTWTAFNPPGAPATTNNGIYGRWRYVPGVNAFVVVTDIDANVHFYKLTDGGALPTDPAPAAPGNLVVD